MPPDQSAAATSATSSRSSGVVKTRRTRRPPGRSTRRSSAMKVPYSTGYAITDRQPSPTTKSTLASGQSSSRQSPSLATLPAGAASRGQIAPIIAGELSIATSEVSRGHRIAASSRVTPSRSARMCEVGWASCQARATDSATATSSGDGLSGGCWRLQTLDSRLQWSEAGSVRASGLSGSCIAGLRSSRSPDLDRAPVDRPGPS